MDRTERVRQVVDGVLRARPDEEYRRDGFVHLYGVARASALLARVRGLDAELGTIAGMLHDLWTYKTGDLTDHARHGTPLAREVLAGLGCFGENEIATICTAIAHHSDKGAVHGAYDELLKDADVLQHHLYNTLFVPIDKERARLDALGVELGMVPKPYVKGEEPVPGNTGSSLGKEERKDQLRCHYSTRSVGCA